MDSRALLTLLLLPLLGGYIFYSKFHLTSFVARRTDGQRLIYSSAVLGVVLLLTAAVISKVVDTISKQPYLHQLATEVAVTFVVASYISATIVFGLAAVILMIPSTEGLSTEEVSRLYCPKTGVVLASLMAIGAVMTAYGFQSSTRILVSAIVTVVAELLFTYAFTSSRMRSPRE